MKAADPLRPRRPAGMGRGAMMALLVHAGLLGALALGVSWRSSEPAGVTAELWAAVPEVAAPAGMAPAVMERLALSVRRTVDDSDFKALAATQNLPLRFLGPEAYRAELMALRARYEALWALHPWRE